MIKIFLAFLICLLTSQSLASPPYHIVIQNLYFPKPGKEKEVYKLRIHASNILEKLGVPKGRVLERMNIKDRPYVMWECNYHSMKERMKIIKIVNKSKRFKKIEARMGSAFNSLTWNAK